jgi:hypothetical protein
MDRSALIRITRPLIGRPACLVQKMTGIDNITFRGNQAAVIQAIQRGASHIMATMPYS